MDEWDRLRGQISDNMQLKTTEELLLIWNQHDLEEWSPLALEVIREILIRRTGRIPDPPSPSHPHAHHRTGHKTVFRLPKDKLIRRATLAYVILFSIAVIANPIGRDVNIVSFLCILGLVVCVCIYTAVLTYRAWTLDSKGFMDWREAQIMFYSDWTKKLSKTFPPSFVLWNARIVGSLGFLMGLGMLILILGARSWIR